MATWDQIAGYVRSNFKIMDEGDEMIMLGFNLDDNRSQTVMIWACHNRALNESWLQIQSPVGERGKVDIEKAAAAANENLCGGIVVTEKYVLLSHSAPMENLDINELTDPMRVVVMCADEIEARLSGQDRF